MVTRLIWFPIVIYDMFFNEASSYPEDISQFDIAFKLNGTFCTVLLALHIYWFYLMLVIAKNILTKGKFEDIQAKVKKDENAFD